MKTGADGKIRLSPWRRNAWLLGFLGILLSACALFFLMRDADMSNLTASRVSRVINKRMARLEALMDAAMSGNHNDWLTLDGLDEDMVVYRYIDDSLQSWCNQFSLDNDDISKRLVVQRFVNLRYNFVSPLAEADTAARYINMGPKWYLVKSVSD